MPYFKRPSLRFSLGSFIHHYSDRNDFEIVIVEDSKNATSDSLHTELLSIIDTFKDKMPIKHIVDPKVSFNPASKYNRGAEVALGSIIVLTNPETPHVINILGEIDKENFSNLYVVCACLSVDLLEDKGDILNSVFNPVQWYQHTQHRASNYHFCSAISKENYLKIGGFNELFSGGIGYDDDNFVKRVQAAQLLIQSRDDLITYHIEHGRDYSIDSSTRRKLEEINREIWRSQLLSQIF